MSELNGRSEIAHVLAFVNSRIARNGPVEDCSLDLIGARIIDSMAMLELVVWLEQTWGLRVRNDDLVPDNFGSITALASYISRSRQAGSPA